jgi:hypothetical protein
VASVAAWRDFLHIAADLLEARVAADVLAARQVIARAAEHAATCEACAGLDPRLLAEAVTALDSWTPDADLDHAALELAHELELAPCRRLTTPTATQPRKAPR